MALVLADRVQVSTTTTGTGTLTLGSALDGFQDFSVIGDGNTTYYTIINGNNWEVGIGTYTASGTTLSRDTILDSSNGGSAINLSGTSNVFVTYPADKNVNADDIGVTVQAYDADTTKNDVANTFTTNQVITVTDNTNAALRVTQLGTGNALLVEDSTNPDSTPFIITGLGRVGIGKGSPSSILDVDGTVTATTFSGSLSGNATTATTLQTARTINGTSFDGSSNITITANTTNALTIGTGLSGSSFDGSAAVTVEIDSTVATLTGTQTLTNKTVESAILNNGYTEEVYAISDGASVNLDPNNGSIQTWTLGASRTPDQANWASGQSITLMIDDGTAYTITWTTLAVVWKTDGGIAPTLNTSGFTVIVLWKTGTTIYGARVGNA